MADDTNSNDQNNNLSDILSKYQNEFEQDSELSEFNLREQQMKLPAIKHKYVAYLMQHKHRKQKLIHAKNEILSNILTMDSPTVGLSNKAMERKHTANPKIQKINRMIEEEDIIIEYLEKIENITRSMTYDLGNLVKIVQMETT